MPELGAGVPSSLGRHAVPLGPFSVAHIFDRDHDRHGTTLRARRFASDDDGETILTATLDLDDICPVAARLRRGGPRRMPGRVPTVGERDAATGVVVERHSENVSAAEPSARGGDRAVAAVPER